MATPGRWRRSASSFESRASASVKSKPKLCARCGTPPAFDTYKVSWKPKRPLKRGIEEIDFPRTPSVGTQRRGTEALLSGAVGLRRSQGNSGNIFPPTAISLNTCFHIVAADVRRRRFGQLSLGNPPPHVGA